MGSKQSAPAAPNYTQAAQATSTGNLALAQEQQAANNVNQVTPYGNLTYQNNPTSAPDVSAYNTAMQTWQQNGGSSSGTPAPQQSDFSMNQPNWTATQTLSPAEQQLFDQGNTLSSSLLDTAQTGLNSAQGILANPTVDMSQLPSTGINPGQSYQDAMMQQLNPEIDRANNQLQARLAAQGVTPGSAAYNDALQQQSQSNNNLLAQATTSGMGMGLQANQQAYAQANNNLMQPINIIDALRTGTQVQSPSYASAAQQSPVAGADLLSALQGNYNAQLGNVNANNATSAGQMGTLAGLGGAGIIAAASDIRLKENIKRIGEHPLGIGIYEFDYIWGEHSIGVMAQEVLNVKPSAVITHPSGYLMVNYGEL